mmetsp:Transcript_98581/g.136771  ORF Transcript_98581/g.136771 Transcript_98581/m.136771 type:complete len:245 (-) Transcript_98581:498-1232(-)
MPPDSIFEAHKQHVELDVALAAIIRQERILDVGLNHIDAFRLHQAEAFGRLGYDVHGRAPVSVRFLHEPRDIRGLQIWWRGASPRAILENVRLRHLPRRQLQDLGLLLQPGPAFEVHRYAAEVRLVGKVHELLTQWAMIFITLLVLKPFLIGIDSPIWSFQQVLAEPLAVTPDLAVRAVPIPLLQWATIRIKRQCRCRLRVIRGYHQRFVINHLLHAGHFLPTLLDLDVSLCQVLVHNHLFLLL